MVSGSGRPGRDCHLHPYHFKGRSNLSRLLSPDQVAEQLGVQVKTVYVLIHERGLPAFRLGRTLRVKEQDMELWLEGQRIRQSGEALSCRTSK